MRAGLIAVLMLAGTAAHAQTVTALVFDVSVSMWSGLEGDRCRIEVARDVMVDYFATHDTGTPISVLADGHHRRGDCGDIQVIAPRERHDGSDLTQRLSALNRQGMTPLTDALEQARAEIPPQAEAADIILITNGLENCGGDSAVTELVSLRRNRKVSSGFSQSTKLLGPRETRPSVSANRRSSDRRT